MRKTLDEIAQINAKVEENEELLKKQEIIILVIEVYKILLKNICTTIMLIKYLNMILMVY
mgnify:CR=1 FL=1